MKIFLKSEDLILSDISLSHLATLTQQSAMNTRSFGASIAITLSQCGLLVLKTGARLAWCLHNQALHAEYRIIVTLKPHVRH